MNVEICKSSFEVPNNTYRDAYEKRNWQMFGDDTIKEYKSYIERLINQMISDIKKLPLIKCKIEGTISPEPKKRQNVSKDKFSNT